MKKIVYVDMDGVLVDFNSGVDSLTFQEALEYEGMYDKMPGIFSRMFPMPGALDAFKRLSEKYDVYILSTAPWGNASAWSDKYEWVEGNLGSAATKRLILSHNNNLNMGDYLIDDRTANGAGEFQGEHIHFGKGEFPDWESVLTYLEA